MLSHTARTPWTHIARAQAHSVQATATLQKPQRVGFTLPRRTSLLLPLFLLGSGSAARAASVDSGCFKECYKACIALAPGSKEYWCEPSDAHTQCS